MTPVLSINRAVDLLRAEGWCQGARVNTCGNASRSVGEMSYAAAPSEVG